MYFGGAKKWGIVSISWEVAQKGGWSNEGHAVGIHGDQLIVQKIADTTRSLTVGTIKYLIAWLIVCKPGH